jgi:hypothetical protein
MCKFAICSGALSVVAFVIALVARTRLRAYLTALICIFSCVGEYGCLVGLKYVVRQNRCRADVRAWGMKIGTGRASA